MYSHRPPHYLEQLYDPIPSVQRTLMLLDIARAVHPETLINRVAYDQDELVKTEEVSTRAQSNVKWDPALKRCKILPSIPQTRINSDTSSSNVGILITFCGTVTYINNLFCVTVSWYLYQ